LRAFRRDDFARVPARRFCARSGATILRAFRRDDFARVPARRFCARSGATPRYGTSTILPKTSRSAVRRAAF
jgi:hypothetical protein